MNLIMYRTLLFFLFFFICIHLRLASSTLELSSSNNDVVQMKAGGNRAHKHKNLESSSSILEESDQPVVSKKSQKQTKKDCKKHKDEHVLTPLFIVEYNTDAYQVQNPVCNARMTKLPEMKCSSQRSKTICVGSRNGLHVRALFTNDKSNAKKVTATVKITGYRCKMADSRVALIAANSNTRYKISADGSCKKGSKNQSSIRGFAGGKNSEGEVAVRYEKVSGEDQIIWYNFREVESATVFYFQTECSCSFGFHVTMVRKKHNESSSESSAISSLIFSKKVLFTLICIFGLGLIL